MANSAFEHTPSFTIPSSITTANSAAIWSAVNNLGQSTIILDSGGNGRIGISGDTNIITLTSGTVTVAGTVAATTLTGAGAGITALSAANITASGTLPALNGAALTALTAANITASGTLPALNGAALTALNGSQITTGTVADARISALTASKLTGALPAISGANLTNLPAGGATINNATVNELVTVASTTTQLDAESTLTYDGTTLTLGSGQIKFPGSVNLSTDVNTLDEYEEGNWTPVIQFGNSTSSFTYGTQAGYYTRIGRAILINGRLDVTGGSTGSTGNAKISGLPIQSNVNPASHSAASIGYMNGFSFANQATLMIQSGSTYLDFMETTESGTVSHLTHSNLTTSFQLFFSGLYWDE